jgi:hypothetical protein
VYGDNNVNARELASIAFGHRGHGIILGLSAYFDASGDAESDPVITLGGYAAFDEVCTDMIEPAWEAAVGKGRVFHLTDFGTPYCQLGSGDWPIQERVDFLKRLAAICRCAPKRLWLFGISVEVQQYEAFLKQSPHAQSVWGPAYSGCAQLCFSLVEEVLHRYKLGDRCVAYVFEKGDRQHELNQSFQEYENRNKDLTNKRSIHFLPKQTVLLQSADLIAGKVQEVVVRAFRKLPSLDNGRMITPLGKFDRYYSFDGTTAALFPDGTSSCFCFVANQKLFIDAEGGIRELFRSQPKVLRKRTKQKANQGRRSR